MGKKRSLQPKMEYDEEISIRYESGTMEDANAYFDAVAEGDYDKMVSLLDQGKANVNQTDSDGFSALMIAASECQEKIVEELIKRDCSVNSVTLTKNNTSLLFAAKVSAFLARHGVGRKREYWKNDIEEESQANQPMQLLWGWAAICFS